MDEAAMQTQALPVSLVPLEEEMQLTQGAGEALPSETPAPTPTSKLQEMEQAQHVGDGDIDTNAPLDPKEKPREVEVAAASTALPQEGENPPPVKETPAVTDAEKPNPPPPEDMTPPSSPPVQEATVAEPEKKLEEVEALSPSLPTLPDRAPAPTQKPEMVAKAPENLPKPEKPVQPTRPERVEQPVETVKPAEAASAPASQADNLEDILAENAALLNRTRTQGGGAKRSREEAGFGSRNTNNDDNRLAQTISNVIGGCVQRNWRLASISGSSAYDLAVKVRVRFHPDGTIDGEPELEPSGGDAAQRDIIAYQASAALRKCAPFNLPADQYNKWRDVTINMRAFPG